MTQPVFKGIEARVKGVGKEFLICASASFTLAASPSPLKVAA